MAHTVMIDTSSAARILDCTASAVVGMCRRGLFETWKQETPRGRLSVSLSEVQGEAASRKEAQAARLRRDTNLRTAREHRQRLRRAKIEGRAALAGQPTEATSETMSVTQASALIGCTANHLYRRIRENHFTGVGRVAGGTRYGRYTLPRDQMEAYATVWADGRGQFSWSQDRGQVKRRPNEAVGDLVVPALDERPSPAPPVRAETVSEHRPMSSPSTLSALKMLGLTCDALAIMGPRVDEIAAKLDRLLVALGEEI